MKQVQSKTSEQAEQEVVSIYRKTAERSGCYGMSSESIAILTLATVIHMNSHPIYVVENSGDMHDWVIEGPRAK